MKNLKEFSSHFRFGEMAMKIFKPMIPFILIMLLTEGKLRVKRNPMEVKSLPFVTLFKQEKTLHMVHDYFRLVQSINLEPIVRNMHDITVKFGEMSSKYRKQTNITEKFPVEHRLNLILEHMASNLDGGLLMLPQDPNCVRRSKRSVEIDEDPVNTFSLFPQVGKLFSWVTGSLSSDAGKYINENYNNIKRLTKMSVRFAQMFNATLAIEHKHNEQMKQIKVQVDSLTKKFNEGLEILDRRIAYQGFLSNLVVVVEDIQRTLDIIFDHTDKVEKNLMGPLARDPSFLQAVSRLMNVGGVQAKANVLYLMKIGSILEVMACNFNIKIIYKFPVLKSPDYIPWRVLSVPKEIKGKYFELSEVPYIITWSDRVYTFTEQEYNECNQFNKHVFCRVPLNVQGLMKNCVYGLISKVPWPNMAQNCPLKHVQDPKGFIEITHSNLIFGNLEKQLASVLCPSSSREGQHKVAKPLILQGSGVITLPTGCRVKLEGKQSFTMGHIERSTDIQFEINDKIWNLNMTRFLPILKIENGKNMSDLWSIDAEENIIREGIADTQNILKYMQFTPSATAITLLTLILYTALATVILIVLFCLVCHPNCVKNYKCCSCNRKKDQEKGGEMICMKALPINKQDN